MKVRSKDGVTGESGGCYWYGGAGTWAGAEALHWRIMVRQKDIWSLDGFAPASDREDHVRDHLDFVACLEGGFRGETDKVLGFWLYDWRNGVFALVREAVRPWQ